MLLADAQGIWDTELPRDALLGLMAANLSAQWLSRWRAATRKPALLAFHVALVAVLLLGLVGRALALEADFALLEGQGGAVRTNLVRRGFATPETLEHYRLTLDQVTTRYGRGDTPVESFAHIRVRDARRVVAFEGRVRPNEPVDAGPLSVSLTSGRGFGALFVFHPRGGAPSPGVLLFPWYAREPGNQRQRLLLPGVTELLWATLELPAPLFRQDGPWELRVPPHIRVGVQAATGETLATLAPSQTVTLPQGTLTLVAVRRWASLFATYDPTEPWLMGLLALLPLLLVAHYFTGRAGPLLPADDPDAP